LDKRHDERTQAQTFENLNPNQQQRGQQAGGEQDKCFTELGQDTGNEVLPKGESEKCRKGLEEEGSEVGCGVQIFVPFQIGFLFEGVMGTFNDGTYFKLPEQTGGFVGENGGWFDCLILHDVSKFVEICLSKWLKARKKDGKCIPKCILTLFKPHKTLIINYLQKVVDSR